MDIIYLHGFKSHPNAIKGQLLQQYCAQHASRVQVHLPDLNRSPVEVMARVSDLIERLERPVLVGSSLGGFYATQLVAKYALPAVLINPAMRPWQLFQERFAGASLPYVVCEHWTLDHEQLQQLEQLSLPYVRHADKILVLLQQGDEILDYREAQRYYSNPAPALIMTEVQGNHAMDNFAAKLPLVLEFLSSALS